MNIVIIIQARYDSTRLPGKVLLPLNGVPLLKRLTDRIINIPEVPIVIATTKNKNDDIIASFCSDIEVDCFRGHDTDVLQRVVDCSREYSANVVVDITADCPLVDPVHINNCLRLLAEGDFDYISNGVIRRFLPDGFDVQVYFSSALYNVNKLVTNEKHRSHVGWNIGIRNTIFDIGEWVPSEKYYLPNCGLVLDAVDDYLLLNNLYKMIPLNIQQKSCEEIIDFLKENEDLLQINQHIKRKIPGEG